MRARAAWGYVAVGMSGIVVFYAVRSPIAKSVVYETIGMSGVAALALGAARNRPARRLPWTLLMVGLFLTVAGEITYDVYHLALHVADPQGTLADVFYLAAYPFLVSGVLLLVRTRGGGNRDALLDAAMVAVAGAVLSWEFLVGPNLGRPGADVVDQLLAAAYPLMDVMVLAVLARAVFMPRSRLASMWLLLGGLGAFLVADVLYATLSQTDSYSPNSWVDSGWLVAYVLVGASGLHPTMRTLSTPGVRHGSRLNPSRLLALGVALVVTPAVVVVQQVRHQRVDGLFMVVATSVMAALVLARTVGAAADRERAQKALRRSEAWFRSLVLHAADTIVLWSTDTTIRYVSPSVERFLGYRADDLVGMRNAVLVDEQDEGRARAAHERSLARPGEVVEVELRLRHRSGGWRWAEIHLTSFVDDPNVAGVVANIRDVTQRKRAELALSHQARHDALTGLPNRAHLIERLGAALARCDRDGSRAAVLFCDLDRFKIVNDSLGHHAGDTLLVAVAERLRSVLRPTDTLARFGGDEFVVLCEGLGDDEDALAVAARLNAALDEPIRVNGEELFVSTSIGVAIAGSDAAPDVLIRDADTAMYRAKEAGRARWEMFDDRARARVVESLQTATALHRALERGELRVHYQPIVALDTGRIAAVEALVRWQHPIRGLLAPSEFLSTAEDTGLIGPIGAWVLRSALVQRQDWVARHPSLGGLRISVNVSARQLTQADLLDLVTDLLAETTTDPDALVLEITETALMGDERQVPGTLRGLRELGVHLAIDDFGKGYSSLSYLKRFAVDTLKVDRAFVEGVGRNPDDDAIVTAAAGMAHALGLTVVAEGVTLPEQLDFLRSVGCDFAQGFALARPQRADAIEPVLVAGTGWWTLGPCAVETRPR